jgi:DNA-binding NtrC family response regulator
MTARETIVETGLVTKNVERSSPARSLSCRVMTGSDRGRQLALGARPIIIGAGGGCDLVLADPKVSRRHVELQAVPDGLMVRDLGSKNGTIVDGARVTQAIFPLSVVVQIGDSKVDVSRLSVPTLPPSERSRFGALVGQSLAMRELFAVLELAAPSDATVLIQGESGTGKELAARGLHDHSHRAKGPFIVLDCSATNEELIESQLFGHKIGAFTGAITERNGSFLEADGGTLFIDEIGELPTPLQAKLLRALESRTVQPLGSDRRVSFDTRVVAATHRDLGEMVAAGSFRFDLFHRLAVVHVGLAPLRDRREDVPTLIAHFYEGRGIDPGPIDGPNLDQLSSHSWPGNVRELRNVLERAWVLSGDDRVRFRDLRLWLATGSDSPYEIVDSALPFKDAKERWIAAFERRYLAAVYRQHDGNISRSAAHAGINRRHFRKLLEDHGLKKPSDETKRGRAAEDE